MTDDLSTGDPILAAFGRRLRRSPEGCMVLGRCAELSVADIDRLRQAAATHLDGVSPGALVGLAAPNGPAFLAAWLALLQKGNAALLFDARTRDVEMHRIAGALGAPAVLRARRAWPRGADDFFLDPVELAAPTFHGGHGVASHGVASHGVAAVKLTSGSTGSPRGIVTPSDALVADDRGLATSMDLRDDERILAAVPMSHSYGLSSVVLPALMRDAVLVVPDEGQLNPLRVAQQHQASFMPTVPAVLQALLKMSQPPPLPSSLRLVISAGAPLAPETAARFRQVYGQPIHVFYGASECGGIAYDRDGGAGERGSLGTPVDGVEVRLEAVAGRANGETPPRGTVTVTSEAVTAGYLGDDEDDGALRLGTFRTRDLGFYQDGELFLEGRLDDLINVKGKKVNPREVEAVIRRLEGVDDVVTLGVRRDGAGEAVRAFVAGRGELSYEAVHAWCRRHLADHKVPRSIVLVEEIPRNARGKLDRAALLALEP